MLTFTKQHAVTSVNLSNDKNNVAWPGFALALAGGSAKATHLAADLANRFPADAIVQHEFLPTIRAAMLLHSGKAGKALEELEKAKPYEVAPSSHLRSGEACLATDQGTAAAGEFQKILDHLLLC